MTSNSAYAELLAHIKETAALGQIGRLMSWDQEVMMPENGTEQRAEQSGALQGVLHARRTDPRIGEWLGAIDVRSGRCACPANWRPRRRG